MGKLLGTLFGFMFARIPGAVLGFIVGHFFDKGYSQDFSKLGGFARFFSSPESFQKNAVFFHSLFSVLGHIAKADGAVTKNEIAIATALMDQLGLAATAREEAQQAFRNGKATDFPLNDVLGDLVSSCHGRKDLLQIFLEILIQAALADGEMSTSEYEILLQTAKKIGFSKQDLEFLLSAHQAHQRFRQGSAGANSKQTRQATLDDAYKILGVSKDADEKTVKRAYKKQMAEHHPDKLAAKGLPIEAMDMAKQKTQAIQAAYEAIKSASK